MRKIIKFTVISSFLITIVVCIYALGYKKGLKDLAVTDHILNGQIRAHAVRKCSKSDNIEKCYREENEFFIHSILSSDYEQSIQDLSLLEPYILELPIESIEKAISYQIKYIAEFGYDKQCEKVKGVKGLEIFYENCLEQQAKLDSLVNDAL